MQRNSPHYYSSDEEAKGMPLAMKVEVNVMINMATSSIFQIFFILVANFFPWVQTCW